MDDRDILAEISRLADEEHRLERSHVGSPLSATEVARLSALAVQLDQCWDLLSQRRARRIAGGDPDDASFRPPSIVENFQQ